MAFEINVTSFWQATEILNEIPAALWRLAFSSLFAQKKFDKLRMTYRDSVWRVSLTLQDAEDIANAASNLNLPLRGSLVVFIANLFSY